MIDYNKLKLALELAKNINKRVSINVCYLVADDKPTFVLDHSDFSNNVTSYNIDDLIIKLQELTKPKPKYEVGQVVWLLSEDKMRSAEIQKARSTGDYLFDDWLPIPENKLYPSKESLIDAQIEHLNKLRGSLQ